jgi:GNAT superfamily N-acetyltransferase
VVVDRPFRRDGGLGPVERIRLARQLDDIFFSSSATQSFDSEAARSQFRERWLGRYLQQWPDDFLVALASEEEAIGYLAGCIGDAARMPEFADISYFRDLADLSARFPSHFHINVAASYRSAGIGACLVETFCDRAAESGAPGVHVVTAKASRNVGFYQRHGFRPLRSLTWNGVEVVMLGRTLPSTSV